MKTTIQTLDEFYKTINEIIQSLRDGDFSEDASKLNVLLNETSWTTSSELIGELMLALQNIKSKYKKDLGKQINECYFFALHHRKILGLDN
jgi:hypothetical protein